MSDGVGAVMDPLIEDGKTVAELKGEDSYKEFEIKEVTPHDDGGWSILTTESMGFGVTAEKGKRWREGALPTAGMTGRLYAGTLGGAFHGIDIDDEEVFWRTPAERVAERVRWLADYDRSQREEFESKRAELDAAYEALIPELKSRIDRFRAEDSGFRVRSEGYEMYSCSDASRFVERARAAVVAGKDAEEVEAFWDSDRDSEKAWGGDPPEQPAARWMLWAWSLDYERQIRVLRPAEGHSGNTFGGACAIAARVLQGGSV